jgi:uncharacterized protein YqgQ
MNLFENEGIYEVKLIGGKYWVSAFIKNINGRFEFQFPFNRPLMAEIKNMEGATWHGYDDDNPRKIWSAKNTSRTRFILKYLMGYNPFSPYEQDFIKFETNRPLYDHQKLLVSHGYTVHHGIWAAEMGTGKSLAFIELMELAYKDGFIKSGSEVRYVGPKAGVRAVGRELIKWDAKIRPKMLTYEGHVKEVRLWQDGSPAPKMVCYDESSKIKTPTAQRSQSCMYVAEAMRAEYGRDGYIIEMTGTPAPKTPVDWWHQCEVACPGFLTEKNIHVLKKRLCLIEERESGITGGIYPHIVTWYDDSKKCKHCGEYPDSPNHDKKGIAMSQNPDQFFNEEYHEYEESINEVLKLHRRMKGLVVVLWKKDCLDLPDKQYVIEMIKPTVEILHAAKLIRKVARRSIEAISMLRELSDGFQYKKIEDGRLECPECFGRKEIEHLIVEPLVTPWEQPTTELENKEPEKRFIECPYCGGIGDVPKMRRETYEVGTPKDDKFVDDLDEHADIGRLIVWAGFQGSIDRLVRITHQQGWATLKIDGRGYVAETEKGEPADIEEFLSAMDLSHKDYKNFKEKYPKICMVGNPGAGGMALTLTASPTMIYFSNSNKGEDRMQSEDRGHRLGMDLSRKLLIKDYIMLPSDKVVRDQLLKKRDLQNLSMGELNTLMEKAEKELI